jgi:cytochrome P450
MLETRNGVPEYRTNIYTTAAIVDPYPHYTALRQLGPVVWLSKHRVYALPRYTECKAVMRDDKSSSPGEASRSTRLPTAFPAVPP